MSAAAGWLDRRDDRARLVALFVLALGLGALQGAAACAAGLALAAAVAASLRPRPGWLLARLAPLLALLVPLLLITPFAHAPEGARPVVAGWTWGPTDRGLLLAGTVAARVAAVGLLAAVGLAAPVERTAKALQDLRVPAPLVHTALLSLRYARVFADDLRRMRQALAARGFRPRPDARTSRTYAGVTGVLLLRSLQRTEGVERAMRARGYQGRLVLPRPRPAGWADVLLVAAAAAAAALLVAADRGAAPWA